MNRLPGIAVASLLALALLGACTREAPPLQSRLNAARTAPAVIADWMIQGRNDFVVYDLRDEAAFAAGHLPNAVRVDPATLQERRVVQGLPDYKKLVFYGADADFDGGTLLPLFEQGLHVLVVEGGYAGWEQQVLAKPTQVHTEADARRAAVAAYFRGDSALGKPQPLKEIQAEQFLRPPQAPTAVPAPSFEAEGC